MFEILLMNKILFYFYNYLIYLNIKMNDKIIILLIIKHDLSVLSAKCMGMARCLSIVLA